MPETIRTRFAPSPTGMMHIGNLRSALYEYLVAKSQGGKFILRIEDTDQERLVPGAEQVIYQTLAQVGLQHDEGPDIGGPYQPYVQSERLASYLPYAEQLVKSGQAYYCFCGKSEEEQEPDQADASYQGYDRHCRDLPAEEVAANLAAGKPYVIRQKMPLTGTTSFHDAVFGTITVENKELEDQILIKSDGYPTYNFANVIDDHSMGITHVVRGSEYLSSTPKYNLLYQAFGWEIPEYVHLPLIMGTDGRKLSKRHGATSFAELVAEGYLVEAIVNYIAFLGWAPGQDTREIFSLEELVKAFKISGINKAPAVFDYAKLDWYNEQYIRQMTPDDFLTWIANDLEKIFAGHPYNPEILAEILQPRLTKKSQLADMLSFLVEDRELSPDLFRHKRSKLTPELCLQVLNAFLDRWPQVEFSRSGLDQAIRDLTTDLDFKLGQVMGPIRLAAARQQVTPGGAVELLLVLGQEASLRRLKLAQTFLTDLLAE